jgi:putative ABC transport system permease protein
MMGERRINLPWLVKMAWRDSRKNRSRLFLFISSMILGIAALVAIYAVGDNLTKDIDQQAATLIGADLDIHTNKTLDKNARLLTDSLKMRKNKVLHPWSYS